ncbi:MULTISPECIES: hypothetical protein [unclassified Streptomyces]|uniref:hypothetical protein n=1 Tax=unclassified Streptomyces TaxID=2593676 RepID=UPI00344B3925
MIYLPMPTWPDVPRPVAGCERCRVLRQQRALAIQRGDRSAASDCNVLIRRHHVDVHG